MATHEFETTVKPGEVVDLDAQNQVRTEVLRFTAIWWWTIAVPIGLYFGVPRILAGTAQLPLILGVAAAIFTGLALVIARGRRFRIWVVFVAHLLGAVGSWTQFGPGLGSGVLALTAIHWAALMLTARAGAAAFVIVILAYIATAVGVVQGFLPPTEYPADLVGRRWAVAGVPAALIALFSLLILARLRIALAQAVGRERDTLRALVRGASQLAEAREALALAQRRATVGVIAAGVAHDVNNVVGAARLELEVLADEASGELAQRAREVTLQLDRVTAHVRDLLAVGRDVAPEERTADVDAVILGLPSILGAVIPRRIRFALAAESGARIALPPVQLQQILANLVLNARDAITAEGEIRVTAVRRDGEVDIEVHDSGCGIPAAAMEQLFTPFFTTKPADVGSGLGLSVVRDLVERAGGRVYVRSTEAVGTTFYLAFPLLPA